MNSATLEKLIELADGHQQADEYISGHYEWKGGACAIGCTIRDAKKIKLVNGVAAGDHVGLAKATNVPELAWRLCDSIFEGLPEEDRPKWTPRFLRAIKPDADYTDFSTRVMVRMAARLADDALNPEIKACAVANGELYSRRAAGDEPTKKEWEAARSQAEAARSQAEAAWSQADAARSQADAARSQFSAWLGDVVCDELSNGN